MLTELVIRNFAIIERLEVVFGPGFNVLTGETGAGKSIIIDALGLLIGGRARLDFIRSGEESATVEACLDLDDHPELRRQLAEAGIEEEGELLVRRVISRSGKNRIYLNGSLATLAQLQAWVGQLLNIYGQHEHQNLQRAETHLELLDRFAGLHERLATYREQHAEVRALAERLAQLEEAERERQQRLDLLTYQVRELTEANLVAGEDEELAAERLLLQHAERLVAATAGGYERLYGAEGAVCERLGAVADELGGLADVDPALGELAETLRSSLYVLEDAAAQLRSHAGRVAVDPERLDEVEGRLALLATLKRKYAPTVAELLDYRLNAEREAAELNDLEATREGLQRQLATARERLQQTGEALSARRREAAGRLCRAVEGELQALAMPRARFEVHLEPLPEPGRRGLEQGTFLIAPNPGEDPKPLARIASGGELSRVMLALKRVAPGAGTEATLVFDEVDAGIGGEAATAVGEKLHGVAQGRQVLCITHLPQVAAFADCHYRVEKRQQEKRTVTALTLLEGEARVREAARMLGGAQVTERTLEHARELIGHCGPTPSEVER